jgi:hypothetical protein
LNQLVLKGFYLMIATTLERSIVRDHVAAVYRSQADEMVAAFLQEMQGLGLDAFDIKGAIERQLPQVMTMPMGSPITGCTLALQQLDGSYL